MKLLLVSLFAVLAFLAAQAEEETNNDWSNIDPSSENYKSNEKRRVFGGKAATKSQFPYQAGLILKMSKFERLCGGSLISNTRVLTAAHCFEDVVSVLVILGARIVEHEEATQVRFVVPLKGIVCHPKFNHYKLENDVAIIKLPSSVKFNDAISPIALAEGTNNFVGETGVISGWGHFDNSKTNSLFLRFANLKIMENSKCSEKFYHIVDSSLCATGQGTIDGCNGDSGGSLAVQKNGKTILVGIQSFVIDGKCGLGTGFARVTSFIPWIKSNM